MQLVKRKKKYLNKFSHAYNTGIEGMNSIGCVVLESYYKTKCGEQLHVCDIEKWPKKLRRDSSPRDIFKFTA